ncbi:MAG TPA: tetratricopeptide repeat protein [Anaerolineaceae bacterium]|nr:tetratricopeptide repeat protein [Anaerolineaceae bacterium]
MPRDSKKPDAPPLSSPQTSKISPENIEQELNAALQAEDYTRALEVLDSAPRWMKRQPEFMLSRATVQLTLGNYQEALRGFREIERKNPRFTPLYFPLALFYLDNDWPAHALQAAKRAQADRDLTDEDRAALEQLIVDATDIIQYEASESGLNLETMQRACIFNEQAQMAMDEDRLSEADYLCKEAIKIAPNWSPPYNNRAQAIYFSGKIAEAIAVSEALLTRSPENTYALSNLVTYYIGLNQPEQAREYARRLEKLSQKFAPDGEEIEHVITALALVEDTPALWDLARRYLAQPSDALFGRSWLCLSVAAIRSGNWKDALKLIKKVNKDELSPEGERLLKELKTATKPDWPGLSWMPPAYPGADQFLHSKMLAEWDALLQTFSDPLSPSQKRKLDNFYQKYPFMLAALKRLLWDETAHSSALQSLVQFELPEADAEILRFALSQSGNYEARLGAIFMLNQTGRYTGPKVFKFWDEDLEEWREVELNTQRIGNVDIKIQPKTLALIEKAAQTKDLQEATALLKKAVEMEPTSPMAVFNLGVNLINSGKKEEGEALIHRSVEIDPNYTYGHAAIALTDANDGREQEALAHLEIVDRADIVAPDTAVIANLAWLTLAVNKHDLETAHKRLDMAVQINPEHRLIKRFKELLKQTEVFYEAFSSLKEFVRESARRAHQKLLKTPLSAEMGLQACLATNTKDMLVSTARFLNTTASGKKGDLAYWLGLILLDRKFLQSTLEKRLKPVEGAALKWLLEAGGVRPWQEFVRKYGDDSEESTYWNTNEPESIPGRLRRTGLFFSGTLEGKQVAFIPADARPLLGELLK